MSVDLAWDDGQQAIVDALGQFCRDRCSDEVTRAPSHAFPIDLWRDLAELGVLATGTPEGDGGPAEIAAAMAALGRAVFPGPLVASFFATQVLPEKERCAVAAGQAIVSAGVPPLMPWAPHATLFIEFEAPEVPRQPAEADESHARDPQAVNPLDPLDRLDPSDALHDGREPPALRAWLARRADRGAVALESTLGGEPWGRLKLVRERELEGVARAHHLSEMALAAYLASAGQRLVEDAAAHAKARTQFGRAIGEFQAVAHPLADCHMRLSASSTLARAAACQLEQLEQLEQPDAGGSRAAALCGAARLSASAAAVSAVQVCHQVFGAIGITLEGPVFHVSRRILQLACLPPGSAPARRAVLDYFGLPDGQELLRHAEGQEAKASA